MVANNSACFYRVDTQIGLQVEVQVQHLGRVAGLFAGDGQDEVLDSAVEGRLAGAATGLCGLCGRHRLSRWSGGSSCWLNTRRAIFYEANHLG